jgi:ABC-type sugar transport system ATPase subunit
MVEKRLVKVRLENITKSFVSRKEVFEAVHNVTIDVYENEFLVLLGPGQCGKVFC